MTDIDLITCERDKLREDKAALVEALQRAHNVLDNLGEEWAAKAIRWTLAKHGGES